MRGKVFPVFDHGLIFKQLQREGCRDMGVASVRARAVNRKRRSRKGAGRYLVNVLASSDELFHRPFSQHAKFGCDETDFASTSPYNGRRTAERNQLFEFLIAKSVLHQKNRKGQDVRVRSVGSTVRQTLRLHLSWAFAARSAMAEKWQVLGRCARCHSFQICHPGRSNAGILSGMDLHRPCMCHTRAQNINSPGREVFHEEMIALGIVVRDGDVEGLV